MMDRTVALALFGLNLISANALLAATPLKARCSTTVLEKALKGTLPSGVILDSAKPIAAANKLPSYCDVRGHIHTADKHLANEDASLHQKEIQFRVYLPSNWNQKFLMLGCGGFCGTVENQTTGLERGYATSATDTGHFGIQSSDATWMRNPDGSQNFDRMANYAYRSPHLVAVAAKALIKSYYRHSPRLSYFMGGSNGGRQALIEAQRFPDDFDGIISIYPALDFSNSLSAFVKNQTAMQSLSKENTLTKEHMALLGKTTLAKCDSSDDLRDNMISEPLQCSFDAEKDLPLCEGQLPGSDCFTLEQARVIKTIMGPTTIKGRVVHQGYLPGYEDVEGNWDKWNVGDNSVQKRFAEGFLKYWVHNNPNYDLRAFDVQANGEDLFTSPSGVELDLIHSAKFPDLAAFKARGGKLILIHGLADPATSALSTIRYYDSMTRFMGGFEKTIEFARLFLVPGFGHGTRPSDHPARIDALLTLERWRENNVAPESILGYNAETLATSAVTRPICVYPAKAKYLGSGSIQEAKNFSCKN